MKVTVRTLDSQNHEFNVENEEITVKEFKTLIFPVVKIDVEKQRIIFKGKVLQDDKKLKDYGVDGFVVHLVQRAPPSSSARTTASTTTPTTGQATGTAYIGAIGDPDEMNGVAQNLVNNLISQFGASNVTASQMGGNFNVNINFQDQAYGSNEVRTRIGTARRFLSHAEHLLLHIDQARPSNQQSCPVHVQSSRHRHSHHHNHHHHCQAATSSSSTQNETTARHGSVSTCTSQEHEPRMEVDSSLDNSDNVTVKDVQDAESKKDDESQTNQNQQQEQQEQNDVLPSALGDIYGHFIHLYQHLLPSLRRYEYLLHYPQSSDRTPGDDNLPDQIAEILHDLSHAFHAMSDLSFNFNSPQPQSLMCFPSLSPMMFPLPFQSSLVTPPSQDSNRPVGRVVSGAQVRQTGMRPVAVAAIPTVFQIPSGRLPPGISRNAPPRPNPEGASTTQTTPNSTDPQTSSSAPSPSQAPRVFQGSNNRGGLPFNLGRGSFGPRSGVITNTIQINMSQPRPSSEIMNMTGQMPPSGLQNIMQNIMQSISGSHSPSVGTNSSTVHQTGNVNPATQNVSSAFATSTTRSTADRQTTNTQNERRRINYHPHLHHHHHHHDGSVIHPDNLLPCGSFHFGPTFHQGESATSISGNRQSQTSSTSTTFTTDTSSQAETQTNANASLDFSNLLGGLIQNMPNDHGHQAEVSLRIEADVNDIEMGNSDTNIDANILMQMFGQQANQAFSSGQDRQTLRDFMRQNFNVTDDSTDSFVSELIDVMADNLTLNDLISLFLGNSNAPWHRMHSPLRQIIEKHFNENRPMNEQNLPQIVKKMASSITEINNEIEGNIQVKPDVDLIATLHNIDVKFMEKLLRLLMTSDTNFAAGILNLYKEYCVWTIAILDRAVIGGADRYFEAFMNTQMAQQLFQDTSPAIRQLLLQMITSRLRSTVASVTVTEAEVNATIVRPSAKSRENPCKGDTPRAAKRAKKNERLDVNELWEELHGEVSSDSEVEGSSPSPQEDWHNHMPYDLALIINRDVILQRDMVPQRPYSDAYLSGLPVNRRQLMTQHSKEANRIDVAASLNRSIKKSGVKRKNEDLKKEVNERELQEMFDATFQQDIRQRLQNDDDYKPRQFPNSEEYFMKDKKS